MVLRENEYHLSCMRSKSNAIINQSILVCGICSIIHLVLVKHLFHRQFIYHEKIIPSNRPSARRYNHQTRLFTSQPSNLILSMNQASNHLAITQTDPSKTHNPTPTTSIPTEKCAIGERSTTYGAGTHFTRSSNAREANSAAILARIGTMRRMSG